jgi:hypothetical protein
METASRSASRSAWYRSVSRRGSDENTMTPNVLVASHASQPPDAAARRLPGAAGVFGMFLLFGITVAHSLPASRDLPKAGNRAGPRLMSSR